MSNGSPKRIDDGGPAFPFEFTDNDTDEQIVSFGMSLRDYFAGQIMVQLIGKWSHDWEHMPAKAYEIADAMIEQGSEVRDGKAPTEEPQPQNQ